MKTINFAKNLLVVVMMAFVLAPFTHADPVVDWGTGFWSNNGPSQVGYGTGWTSASTPTDGTVTANVAYALSGTTAVVAGNLSASTDLSGGTLIKSLRLQQQNDANTTVLNSFSKVTLTFNLDVKLANSFTIYDVDIGGGWADFAVVTAYLDGNALTTSYTPTATYNQAATLYGLAGVRGLQSANNVNAEGNVGIAFGGFSFDTIEIVFTQQPSSGGSSHGIGISNVALTVVPEPNTAAVLALAGVAFVVLRLRRRRPIS